MIYRLPDKQPSETIKDLFIDFTNVLLPKETISSVSVTGSVANVVVNVRKSGLKIMWDVTGGADQDSVNITVIATGSLGSVREANALLMIKEVV